MGSATLGGTSRRCPDPQFTKEASVLGPLPVVCACRTGKEVRRLTAPLRVPIGMPAAIPEAEDVAAADRAVELRGRIRLDSFVLVNRGHAPRPQPMTAAC